MRKNKFGFNLKAGFHPAGVSVRWILFLVGILVIARAEAQAPPHTDAVKPSSLPYSEAEKTLALQITAQPLEDALKTIAVADSMVMTEGLFNAMKEIAGHSFNEDPHRSAQLDKEDEAVAARAGLPVLAADARFNQAQSMVAAGEVYESIAVFDQTLELYQVAAAPPKKRAIVYLGRAVSLLRLGDLPSAIADDNEALRIFKEAGDEVDEARAENGLGNALMQQGSYSESEAAFSDALRLARAHGEKLGEAFVLNNMSMLRSAQSDYPGAIRFAEQALEIKRQQGNKTTLASSLINLSNFYHLQRRDEDANRMLDEAAELSRSLKNKAILAKALAEKGIIQLETNHPEAALKLIEEGDGMGEGIGDLKSHIQNLDRIGEANEALKNDPLALKFYQEASTLAEGAGMPEQMADISLDEAQLYFQQGKLDEARSQAERTINAVEKMRNNVSGGAADRQRFLSGRTDPYRLLAIISAMQGNWSAALESSEKGKGRILLDLYTDSGLGASASLSEEERAEEMRLRSKFLSLDMQSGRQAAEAETDPSKKNDLDLRLKDSRTALETFRNELYTRHPDLRMRRADFSMATLSDMQALLPDRSAALLEYELTASGNYIFVVTRGSGESAEVSGYKLAVTDAELQKHVRRFHQALSSRDPEFAAESKWLYTALVRPAQTILKGKSSLVIVPDGLLWQVPFQALQRPDGVYLIENASIAYAPSFTVLKALKKTAQKRHSARTMLAMGNPDGETPVQADEVRALQQLYGEKSSRTYLGRDATVNQFRKSSAGFDVVHVAAHGIFNDREPMSSHMILASSAGQPQAGWLRAREIQSLQLHAELVVLSGCETGQGTFEDGEGLLGMSWAVLAAGAHGSLASAWRVEASSTTQMMIAFHQEMLHGVNKAESLRRSEIKLIHSEKYKHPFYWAGFVFMGDAA